MSGMPTMGTTVSRERKTTADDDGWLTTEGSQSIRIAIDHADSPEVTRLLSEASAHQSGRRRRLIRELTLLVNTGREDAFFAIAKDLSGRAIGCGVLTVAARSSEVKCLYVRPPFRGHGVGRRLLELFETIARINSCTSLDLTVDSVQFDDLALYQQCGFQKRKPCGPLAEDEGRTFMSRPIRSTVRRHAL